jgi:hypothetical protein
MVASAIGMEAIALESLMRNEDLLKCPLLESLDDAHRTELLALINNSRVKEKLEQCIAMHSSDAPVKAVCAGSERSEFDSDVRSWKPDQALWKRSPKE